MNKIQILLFVGLLLMPSSAFALMKPVQKCVVTGCSSEICAEAIAENIMGICLWQEHYICFKEHGICAENSDGKCVWTQTKALKTCVERYLGAENENLNKKTIN